jgi:hypothetical protein
MARHWSPEQTREITSLYVKGCNNLQLKPTFLDKRDVRSTLLHEAQVKVLGNDTSLYRDFLGGYASDWIKTKRAMIYEVATSIRGEEIGIPSVSTPILQKEIMPVAHVGVSPDPMHMVLIEVAQKLGELGALGTRIIEAAKEPVLTSPKESLGTPDAEDVAPEQKPSTSTVTVTSVDSHQILPALKAYTRSVFEGKPPIIVCGFGRSLTSDLQKTYPMFECHLRHLNAALMQTIAEHPDTNVLLLSDRYKLNPRLTYLCQKLEIKVFLIPEADLHPTLTTISKVWYSHQPKDKVVTKEGIPDEKDLSGWSTAVNLPKYISVQELADRLKGHVSYVLEALNCMGVSASPDLIITFTQAAKVCDIYSVDVILEPEPEPEPEISIAIPKQMSTPEVVDEYLKETFPDVKIEARDNEAAVAQARNYSSGTKPIVFITVDISSFQKQQLRERFAARFTLIMTEPQSLHEDLVGTKEALIIHFSEVAPSRAQGIMKSTGARLVMVRQNYDAVLSKLLGVVGTL